MYFFFYNSLNNNYIFSLLKSNKNSFFKRKKKINGAALSEETWLAFKEINYILITQLTDHRLFCNNY